MSSSGDHAEVLAKPDTFRGLEWDVLARRDGAAAGQLIGDPGDASVKAIARVVTGG